MKPKRLILPLLGTFLAFMASQWPRIRYELRTVPSASKILLAIALGIFVTLALLHGLDLLPEFLSIFNIQFL